MRKVSNLYVYEVTIQAETTIEAEQDMARWCSSSSSPMLLQVKGVRTLPCARNY
jgi:hypothetical protein